MFDIVLINYNTNHSTDRPMDALTRTHDASFRLITFVLVTYNRLADLLTVPLLARQSPLLLPDVPLNHGNVPLFCTDAEKKIALNLNAFDFQRNCP